MTILIIDTNNNELDDILQDPKDPNFVAKEIIHARLQIRTRPQNKDPQYYDLQLIDNPAPNPPDQLAQYVAKITSPNNPRPTGPSGDVYDIPVNQQCWVVLELDAEIPNWRFFGPGITSKATADGSEFGLKYVLDGEGLLKTGPIPDGAPCRVMVLGISTRGAAPNHHGYLNLYVEFVQGRNRLQFIIDPDIPNGGGDPIPP